MNDASERRYEVDPRTLEMLVCPLTKTRLVLSADRTELITTYTAARQNRIGVSG